MSACTLPEKTQAEVLDRPDHSSLIRGAGREEAMRDLKTTFTDDEWWGQWKPEDAECYLADEMMPTTLRPLGKAKAGTHHLGFFD